MIIESIILIIFVCSLGGVIFILARKIPVLSSLPENGSTGIKKHKIILKTESKIKEVLNFFEKQIFLHKLLSWIKILILRVETKIDVLLHKIRKKNQQEKKDK
ncbi:MAG: hypothetical protein WCK10_03550 [Candidatus Staskawiczbacteria bacterium]